MGQRLTRRERLRAEALQEITDAARRQVQQVGAANLSLRGVAADVDMSPAGLYRYFASRDDLLTALITQAFDAQADAVEAARDRDPDADVADRLLAAASAYRAWGVTHPQEFGLIYGDPIPGYAAPQDGPTTAASRRVGIAFLGLFIEAWQVGRLRVAPDPVRTRSLDPLLEGPARDLHPDLPPAVLAVAMSAWAGMHGLVCLEVFGHLHWALHDAEPLFAARLRAMLVELGMREEQSG